ncbi:hypothetical protein [Rhizobium sp. CF142]|uniref:hypothetical protein n=1 Tax=Rhizobium sp. CF142 TaxID=1144314 RepID=UPI00026EFC63|nr:hypothetical protein [Rhizobium sp. CF142]EJJ24514.1 hypothetical protein PMI11_07269 [Rhizobium sp. CF142]
MHSRWRPFLLAIIILFPSVGISKEALTFEQALDKYSGTRHAIYQCSTTARIVGKKLSGCWRAVLFIQMGGKYAVPPLAIDDAAAWRIIEETAGAKGPTRFAPSAREKSLSRIAGTVAGLLGGHDHPDFDMINCLSELEFQGIEDSLSCNYAYARVRLIMANVADAEAGEYRLDRAEFPYVLQQSLERAYAGIKTPQP